MRTTHAPLFCPARATPLFRKLHCGFGRKKKIYPASNLAAVQPLPTTLTLALTRRALSSWHCRFCAEQSDVSRWSVLPLKRANTRRQCPPGPICAGDRFSPQNARASGLRHKAFPTEKASARPSGHLFFPAMPGSPASDGWEHHAVQSGFAWKLCPISMLTLPSHYGKSVVFPCVRLRAVALATTRAIHIFNVELLYMAGSRPSRPAHHACVLRLSANGKIVDTSQDV